MMKKIKAFTLAEVLITLAIIGIVSALVIPSVLKNYNDRKYNTARLKALKTFGEAGKLASINGEINGQPSARAFVENVLSKYLKIVKVCDNNKASECNFPTQILASNSSAGKVNSNSINAWNNLNTGIQTGNNLTPLSNTNFSVYVMTTDGFSAKLFYNPNCVKNSHDNPYLPYGGSCTTPECITWGIDDICMNVIYDMNGTKNPNHVGEDIGFVSVFWSGLKSTSAAPGILPYEKNIEIYNMGAKSSHQGSELCISNGTKNVQYSLPSVDELSSIILNMRLSSIMQTSYWSSSKVFMQPGTMWGVHNRGDRSTLRDSSTYRIWCVRR